MKKFFLIFIYFSISILITFSVDNKKKSDESILIKRKVAIIPFYNSTEVAEYDYLSNIISDSLRASIDQTKMYFLYEAKELDRITKKNNINTATMIWESTAVEIADILNADVVIFGFYQVSNEQVIINLNAVDAAVRKSAIAFKVKCDLGVELLNATRQATEQMAERLKEKLPPFVKKIKTIERAAIIKFDAEKGEVKLATELEEQYRGKLLEKGNFELLDEQEVAKILADFKTKDKKSLTITQLVQLGQMLDVRLVITGKLKKKGKKLTLILKGIDCEKGNYAFTKNINIIKKQKLETTVKTLVETSTLEKKVVVEPKKEVKEKKVTKTDKDGAEKQKKIAFKKKVPLTPFGNAGVILVSLGAFCGISGGAIFMVDNFYILEEKKKQDSYESYQQWDQIDQAFFISSIALMGTGGVMILSAIPLFILNWYKLKKGKNVFKTNKVSFQIDAGREQFTLGVKFFL